MPPTTPFALDNVSVDVVAGPLTVAAPVQMVPFAAVPENVNWPLNVEPLTLPLMSPDQRTELESRCR